MSILINACVCVCVQAQEEAELAQLQKAKRKALEQRDAQMRQLDDLKARILAERYQLILLKSPYCRVLGLMPAESSWHHRRQGCKTCLNKWGNVASISRGVAVLLARAAHVTCVSLKAAEEDSGSWSMSAGRLAGWKGSASASKLWKKLNSSNRRQAHLASHVFLQPCMCYSTT